MYNLIEIVRNLIKVKKKEENQFKFSVCSESVVEIEEKFFYLKLLNEPKHKELVTKDNGEVVCMATFKTVVSESNDFKKAASFIFDLKKESNFKVPFTLKVNGDDFEEKQTV